MAVPQKGTSEVLAWYNDDKTGYKSYTAIITDTYGKGKVVLCGPHPELEPEHPEILFKLIEYLTGENVNDYTKKENYQVKNADFKLMINAVGVWFKTHKTLDKVHLRLNGVKIAPYVSYTKYQDMKTRWDAYIKSKGKEPGQVWINRPTSTSTIGPIQTKLQNTINFKFTSFTQFYNWILKNADYSYYFDNKYTLKQEIDRKVTLLNCVDFAGVAQALGAEMGYQTRFIGIYCTTDKINHAYVELKGKEFNEWTAVDLAAAASSNYVISKHWCNGSKQINPSWIPFENL